MRLLEQSASSVRSAYVLVEVEPSWWRRLLGARPERVMFVLDGSVWRDLRTGHTDATAEIERLLWLAERQASAQARLERQDPQFIERLSVKLLSLSPEGRRAMCERMWEDLRPNERTPAAYEDMLAWREGALTMRRTA